MKSYKEQRFFLNCDLASMQQTQTDQQKQLPQPPVEKPFKSHENLTELPAVKDIITTENDLFEIINQRRSRRNYTGKAIDLNQLSFLLWCTQGVKKILERKNNNVTFRTVPSAGARHLFETYLAVLKVEGLKPGIYRYCALEHKLEFLHSVNNLPKQTVGACLGQEFVGDSSVVFFWSAIPYRCEWRYAYMAAKLILLDAGHVCQNLYLASEALGLGTCGIAAYDQQKSNELIKVDGEDEMIVYIASVGKRSKEEK
ncbi:MAG: SagB/ThcOx family dehydrogenase [Candidatus Cloacimonetes bacterium]|nr:SagB/ThcOx family dehydrogenase [Candidatus Cloacimonadota bacterium]